MHSARTVHFLWERKYSKKTAHVTSVNWQVVHEGPKQTQESTYCVICQTLPSLWSHLHTWKVSWARGVKCEANGLFSSTYPTSSCPLARTTPILEVYFHFDLSYTPAKFCYCILHRCNVITLTTCVHRQTDGHSFCGQPSESRYYWCH